MPLPTTRLPVKWHHFGSPTSPLDIGGSAMKATYVENCMSVYQGHVNELDKGLFYQDETAWTKAGAVAPQSIEERRLLENDTKLYDEYKGNVIIFELGPGDFTKTKILLGKILARPCVFSVRYIAIDINKSTLLELSRLDSSFSTITMHSLHGNCDQAFEFVNLWEYNTKSIHIWCFGSGPLSNGPDETVVHNIAKWSLVGQILLGQSTTQSVTKHHAYKDDGPFFDWIESGLRWGDLELSQLAGHKIVFFTSEQRTIEYDFQTGSVQVSLKYEALRRRIIVFKAYQKQPLRMFQIAGLANCTASLSMLSNPSNGSVLYTFKVKEAECNAEESKGDIQLPGV